MVDAKADVDKYYNTQDLKNITLLGEWNAMEETRDAFTDNCVISNYSGASTIELNLKLGLHYITLANYGKAGWASEAKPILPSAFIEQKK